MKRCIATLVLSLLPLHASGAGLGPADFRSCADVQGPFAAGSLYQLHLGRELMNAAGPAFEDVRLFDEGGGETPFVIIEDVPPHETVETYPLEITGYDSDATSATVYLRLPQKHRPVSVLELDIPDKDFRKRAVLSHSSDNTTWRTLAEDVLYDFSSNVAVRRTRIGFAKTESRYFRLKLIDYPGEAAVKPGMRLMYEGLDFRVQGAAGGKLRINSSRAVTGTPVDERPVYDHAIVADFERGTDKDGNTVLTFKAGLPVDRLTLDAANPYYHRAVRLFGSATGKEDSYHALANEAIYRFPLPDDRREERNVLEPHARKQNYLRLVIINKNNPPLEIRNITLSWVRQNLYFIALGRGAHRLCSGNPRAQRPEYDLANFVNRRTLGQRPYEQRGLSPLRASGGAGARLAESVAGREKLILKTVVILLVAGMGFWLFRLMRKTSRKE